MNMPRTRGGFNKAEVAHYLDGHHGAFETFAEVHFEQDAEFIAHAREDVPLLLAEIDRLRAIAHFTEQGFTEGTDYTIIEAEA